MSVVGNLNEQIYKSTGGDLGIKSTGASNNSMFMDVAEMVGKQYTAKPFQENENTIYENQKRIEKVYAVSSLVMEDYAVAKQRSMYSHINMNDASTQSYLSSIGYGTAAQTKAANMLSGGLTGSINVSNSPTIPGLTLSSGEAAALKSAGQFQRMMGGTQVTFSLAQNETVDTMKSLKISMSGAGLSSRDTAALRSVGQLTKTIGGEKVSFSVAGTDKATVMKTLDAANNEAQKNHRVMNAYGKKAQYSAMNEMRAASMNKLKADGIDIGQGTLSNIAKQRRDLVSQRNLAVSAGKTAQVKVLDSKISALDSHKKMFGGTEQAKSNMDRSKKIGLRVVSRGVMGDDFYQGVETYRRVGTVATASVKTAVRLVDSAAFNTGKILSKAVPGADKIGLKSANQMHEKLRENAKEKARAKKNGTTKEYKQDRRKERDARRKTRELNRESRFESKQTKLRNDGKTKQADKNVQRHDRKKERSERIAKVKNDASKGFGKLGEWGGKVSNALFNNPLMKLIKKPLAILNQVKATITKVIGKYILIPCGVFLLIIFEIIAMTDIIIYVLFFLSEGVKTGLVDGLNDANYVQIVVDEVSSDLGQGLVKVAKKDAERYYLTMEEGKISGLFSFILGEIGFAVDDTGRQDTAGAIPSDGLAWHKMPAEGEVGYIYSTADGSELSGVNENLLPIISAMHLRYYDDLDYEHWQTARAYAYYMYVQTHDIKGYRFEDTECDQTFIYEAGEEPSWDTGSKSLSRPKELCKNLYIHGYDKDLNKKLNKAKMASKEALSKAFAFLELPFAFDPEEYGIFIGTLPCDSVGDCDNAGYAQYGDDPIADTTCGKIAHVHGDGNCNEDACSHSCDETETTGCTHHCDDECCSIEGHAHIAWGGPDAPGCWKTVYFCKGHCGQHIIPQVDILVDMDYRDIVAHDNFKTVYFLGESDFETSWLDEVFKLNSISQWKEYWNKKMTEWFLPFPNSPASMKESFIRWRNMRLAEGIDSLTSKISSIITGGSVESAMSSNEVKDVFDFDGWYDKNGVLDESLLKDLEDIYGKYEDKFKDGYETWEDFEVMFPIGFCRAMSTEQIKDVEKQLAEKYPGLSESRIKALKQAMDDTGDFWYDLSTKTGTAEDEDGRIDCSGFVSSVLRHGIGWGNDWTASGFASAGSNYGGDVGSLTPGDIVAMNTTASWSAGAGWGTGGTNHVVIFVGLLDGVEGYPDAEEPGFYIIDCSSSHGGSKFRKVDASFFNNYPYVYDGCY